MSNNYLHYVHKRAFCHACVNNVDNQPTIINAIMEDADGGLLDSFTLEAVSGSEDVVMQFKKKTDTTVQVLEPDDVFVVYPDGTKMAYTAEEFDATYTLQEGAFADCAECDVTKITS